MNPFAKRLQQYANHRKKAGKATYCFVLDDYGEDIESDGKVYARTFRPWPELPPPLSKQETEQLLAKWDDDAKWKLVQGHMRLAFSLAGAAVAMCGSAIRANRTTPEDVLSAARVGLIVAIFEHLKPRPGMNSIASYVSDYIAASIRSEIYGISLGARYCRQATRSNCRPVSDCQGYSEEKEFKLNNEVDESQTDPLSEIDAVDALHGLALTSTELGIVRLKREGKSFREIGKELHIPESTVRDTFNRVLHVAEDRLWLDHSTTRKRRKGNKQTPKRRSKNSDKYRVQLVNSPAGVGHRIALHAGLSQAT